MARFIEVTDGDGTRLVLNVAAIAEFSPFEDGTSITMRWSREGGKPVYHHVREAVDEVEHRIAEDAAIGFGGLDAETALERIKALREKVRARLARTSPPPAEG